MNHLDVLTTILAPFSSTIDTGTASKPLQRSLSALSPPTPHQIHRQSHIRDVFYIPLLDGLQRPRKAQRSPCQQAFHVPISSKQYPVLSTLVSSNPFASYDTHFPLYPLDILVSHPGQDSFSKINMDDPGDPSWIWPHWKFGLKREDLFSKLHDQYNTFPSSIQDPEAFHHDVFEISNEATSTDEFYRLLQDRKIQRLSELNTSLQSAAFEIIANPSLIGTEQWHHAAQLFRTQSLDSLVRYFASYLPETHPWHKPAGSRSISETSSYVDSLANSHDSIFDDHFDEPIMTDEPLDLEPSFKVQLPPSPRSMTMCSDESAAASPMDTAHHHYVLDTMTPPRTLSYSESDRDCDEDFSQPIDAESPATSISGMSEIAIHDDEKEVAAEVTADAPTSVESETPTPKPDRQSQSASFFDSKPALPQRRYRSVSPSRPHPLAEDEIPTYDHDPRRRMLAMEVTESSARLRRRDCSPMQRRRRCPGEPATRVEKSKQDTTRSRPKGRRWAAEC